MGYAVARAARNHGAKVILISGPVHLMAPQHIETIRVKTANEMHAAVMTHVKRADVVIKAAAVADYRPASRAELKTKKSTGPSSINLVQISPASPKPKSTKARKSYKTELNQALSQQTVHF